jgi:hypothetical protein
LTVGTFGGLTKVTGSGENKPIEPVSIIAKPVAEAGAANIMPIPRGTTVLYVQRGQRKLRSFEFDAISNNYVSVDRNLVADHIFTATSFAKQIAFSSGEPDILWAVREDGQLAGVTFKQKEDVSGWHRHIFGGSHTNATTGVVTKPKCLSVSTVPQVNNFDQVWVVNERLIGTGAGLVRRYVEFFQDSAELPRLETFFTGEANEVSDTATFNAAMFEAQKDFIHLDSHLTLEGGVAQGTNITPGATTGDGITFTAGASIFSATDVGKEIWKKNLSIGGTVGRCTIVLFTNPTTVVCDIFEDFDNTSTISDGDWVLTTDTISGLEHLEGSTVDVFGDGRDLGSYLVTNGTLSTSNIQFDRAHIGFKFVGLMKTLNIEVGGEIGAAQARQRNVEKVAIRFLGTLKTKVGTNRYTLEEIPETN